MSAQRSPEESCQAALRRDPPAIDDLYDLLAGSLYGVALELCACPDAAASVCTDVFVHMSRHPHDYDRASGSVLQWAAQLVHRFALLAAVDEQTAERRTIRLAPRTFLSEQECDDLSQAYFSGLTYHEIARRRETTPTAVSTTLSTGLRRLQYR